MSSISIILLGKRELVALLNLFSWCLVKVEWLFLGVPWGCLRFVIVSFSDHTYYLTRCILMNFPRHIDSISMRLPIMYFKGSKVYFSKF